MIVSVTSMAVLVPATAFMFDAFEWYSEVQSSLAINRQARLVFDLMQSGAKTATNGNDGKPYAYGLRGRKVAPTGTLRSNYMLQYASNNKTVTGDSFATLTVTCTAVSVPLPDCSAANQTKAVTGWMGDDVLLNSITRSVKNRTVEVTVTITDPFQAQRATNSKFATEIFRTVVTLNRDEVDP